VVFGAPSPEAGSMGSLYHLGADPRLNHEVETVPGVLATEATALLAGFFAGKR
jgi:tRNA(adenine34) deaminase